MGNKASKRRDERTLAHLTEVVQELNDDLAFGAYQKEIFDRIQGLALRIEKMERTVDDLSTMIKARGSFRRHRKLSFRAASLRKSQKDGSGDDTPSRRSSSSSLAAGLPPLSSIPSKGPPATVAGVTTPQQQQPQQQQGDLIQPATQPPPLPRAGSVQEYVLSIVDDTAQAAGAHSRRNVPEFVEPDDVQSTSLAAKDSRTEAQATGSVSFVADFSDDGEERTEMQEPASSSTQHTAAAAAQVKAVDEYLEVTGAVGGETEQQQQQQQQQQEEEGPTATTTATGTRRRGSDNNALANGDRGSDALSPATTAPSGGSSRDGGDDGGAGNDDDAKPKRSVRRHKRPSTHSNLGHSAGSEGLSDLVFEGAAVVPSGADEGPNEIDLLLGLKPAKKRSSRRRRKKSASSSSSSSSSKTKAKAKAK
ncbi:hypothetical protein PTSG_02997 [Salpingoeca rosetta]|uniref:Uncharacterized protein n=1 Tax=Salpingoeca rosetta (strain ATCC 50818 / BSB-021) TaxID=946362 RepID=F2U3Z0_SALR5|nr:uncharacterized protein PTSG_02997 [Salpingoeca rosetta]EGD82334.1 hypothetical protein PTSG_02997 [Salpingoeca rosetta]|eukprot:XP_004996517.1 hypothetical protein PTSG_02997 [Salpingoeca rosetta]